ncbi:MAG: redox-regulated ATPase YchF [Actinobacteria bacterium]|nr:redox-regulated ATPase YchF [Actinomycetota bacterium]
MNVTLVGHPLSGKSTLFSALTGIDSTAEYGKTAKVGTVKVPDERVEWLAGLYKPKKITHAGLDFTDLPGLSFASAAEQAQSVKLIADIRQTDMIVLVLRAFDNPVVPAYRDRVDPGADLTELRSEFILCDMEQVSNRVDKLKVQITKPTPHREQYKKELELMEKALETLENEQPISSIIHSPDEAKMLRSFGFLTEKPWAVVVNVSESDQQEKPSVQIPADIAQLELCVSMEQELSRLSEEERGEFMSELGIETLAVDRLIACCYKTLGLVSFLTYGPDECRAWTIPANTSAVEAAGKIHSDIQRGFIRAEVVAFEDLKVAGDFRQAKAANKVRLESKQYQVQDGDVITFRFNV